MQFKQLQINPKIFSGLFTTAVTTATIIFVFRQFTSSSIVYSLSLFSFIFLKVLVFLFSNGYLPWVLQDFSFNQPPKKTFWNISASRINVFANRMYLWRVALGSTWVACNGLLIGLVPFFSEKISLVSGRVTFFLVKRSHLLVFPLAFMDSFIERSRETRERGTKAPLHTPPWARASAKLFQSHCYAWLFNQKTGSWASACRDHLKSITMLFFCYVITAVNWQQKHFSDISRTVNLLVIDFWKNRRLLQRLTTSIKWSHQT